MLGDPFLQEEGLTMKRYLCSLVALGLFLGMAGQATAQPTHRFTTLDVPGASYANTTVNGINDTGQIVGFFSAGPNSYGFLLDHGGYTTLDVPGSRGTTGASGINASGQIVGWYTDGANKDRGFLLDQGGYTTLDVPGSIHTHANGINASGQIVGSYTDAGGIDHGFLLDNGNYTTLDMPGSSNTPFSGCGLTKVTYRPLISGQRTRVQSQGPGIGVQLNPSLWP
jgi:probable HAF family extracellular repeat protein